MNDLRILMLWALMLDWLGQFLILGLILLVPALTGANIANYLQGQWAWLILPDTLSLVGLAFRELHSFALAAISFARFDPASLAHRSGHLVGSRHHPLVN